MKAPADLVFLHTSEGDGLVAVAHGGRLAIELLEARERRAVVAALETALRRLGIGLGALGGVLVSRGPGSFTGIRVGIATAQGLAAARRWRVWVCDSLEVEAAACHGDPAPLVVCHDARRGEVYAALYDVSGIRPRALVAPLCAGPEAASGKLLGALPAGVVPSLVGSGRLLLEGAVPGWQVRAGPTAEQLAVAAFAVAQTGAYADLEAQQVEPFYLRRPDVQLPRPGR